MLSKRVTAEIDLISSVENDPVQLEKIALSRLSDFRKYSELTRVRFIYRYANNEYNRDRGRANNFSATREGTINLQMIPSSARPRSRNSDPGTVRYYDFNRRAWRSFRRENIILITQVYSLERQIWTTDLSEFENFNPASASSADYAAWIARIRALNPDNSNPQ